VGFLGFGATLMAMTPATLDHAKLPKPSEKSVRYQRELIQNMRDEALQRTPQENLDHAVYAMVRPRTEDERA
jgi:hypothetical protein